MQKNCDVFAILSIYSQSGGIQKVIFLLRVTFYLTKTENRTKKSLAQLLHYCFE